MRSCARQFCLVDGPGSLISPVRALRTISDRLLKELDNLGAVLVAASHNNYVSVRDDLDGWPSRFGDPGTEASQAIRNLIVVSGIDKNSRASMLNPYAEWLAMAPGFEVNVADVVGHGYGLDDGASLGNTHPPPFPTFPCPCSLSPW